MPTKVPRDPNLTPEMRRFLDDLSRPETNIFNSLTATQATALLDVFTSALKGLVPASGGGTTKYLRADGTFAVPTDNIGSVIQSLTNTNVTQSNPTTTIPRDDTVPLVSEGTEILSQAITPADNTNQVLARASVFAALSTNVVIVIAMFRGSTCIGAIAHRHSTADAETVLTIEVLDSPASASAQTYSVRVGPSNAGTVYVNGLSTGRLFGGVAPCTLTLMEIAA